MALPMSVWSQTARRRRTLGHRIDPNGTTGQGFHCVPNSRLGINERKRDARAPVHRIHPHPRGERRQEWTGPKIWLVRVEPLQSSAACPSISSNTPYIELRNSCLLLSCIRSASLNVFSYPNL